jgi:hypothetical protein
MGLPYPAARRAASDALAVWTGHGLKSAPRAPRGRAGGWGDKTWIANTTIVDKDVRGDGQGEYVYAEGTLSRLGDDADADFLFFQTRTPRHGGLVIPDRATAQADNYIVNVPTCYSLYVRGYGGTDWFPELDSTGSRQVGGYLQCYLYGGGQWQVRYPTACIQATTDRAPGGAIRDTLWRLATDESCLADVWWQPPSKGKVTQQLVRAGVPLLFDVTSRARMTLTEWR